MVSSSFSMSKQDKVCHDKRARELQSHDECLSFMFTGADGPDKPVPGKEDNLHIDDDFEYECDAPECTLTNETPW